MKTWQPKNKWQFICGTLEFNRRRTDVAECIIGLLSLYMLIAIVVWVVATARLLIEQLR